jgi:hypothetical protein
MSAKGHSPTKRIVGYFFCAKCGLVYLKNEATRKAINAPCEGDK